MTRKLSRELLVCPFLLLSLLGLNLFSDEVGPYVIIVPGVLPSAVEETVCYQATLPSKVYEVDVVVSIAVGQGSREGILFRGNTACFRMIVMEGEAS